MLPWRLAHSLVEERVEEMDGVLEHGLREARVEADPKDIVHDKVRVGEGRGNAVVDGLVGGLAHEVAAEEEACADLVLFEVGDEVVALHAAFRANGQRKSKPTGVGGWGRLG